MSGGTNSKVKANNKQVKKQYQYDKEFRNYQTQENEARFDKAVLDRELQQANYDQQADYKDAIKIQEFNNQQDLQKRQFRLDKQVYKQSLEDYDAQTELNSMSGALALESAQRAKQEALISKTFDLKDQSYDYNEASKNIGYDRKAQEFDFKEASKNIGYDRRAQKIDFKEATANIGFDKELQRSTRAFAKRTDKLNQDQITDKKGFARTDSRLDQKEIRKEKQFTRQSYKQEDKKLDYTNDKLDKDITFLEDKSGWDVEAAKRTYEKAQVPNFNQRIEALIAREKAEGTARSAGREGLSAEREATSAIAEYGRTQAKLVDDLVFAKEDKEAAETSIGGTKTYQTDLKNKDKDILKADKKITKLTKNRKISKLNINSSKLTSALKQTLSELNYSSKRSTAQKNKTLKDVKININRLDSKEKFLGKRNQLTIDRLDTKEKYLGKRNTLAKNRLTTKENYLDKRNELNKSKIRTTFDSAKAQFKADQNKIKLDEYSANLAAQGQIPARPKRPIPLPKPLATPRTQLAMPFAPSKTPKPVKGALGKTSVWNDVGDIANVGLQVAGLFL